jgi:hypothetical protein
MTDTQIGATLLTGLLSGLAAESWIAGVVVTIATAVAIIGTERGWFVKAGPVAVRFWFWLRGLFARKQMIEMNELYDLLLGHDPATGQPDLENLADLGHVGVYGTTRFGKTTWLHSIIHDLIEHHKPSELRLCISDPKTVDYPFYGRLPHLLCPIARDASETEQMIDRLLAEMEARIRLFEPYAKTAVCNSLERYHALSGQTLPRIVAIFDELADVVPAKNGSEIERKLIRLAKLSLAYGIQLVCATQRPSVAVMNGEIKSQFASLFVTWMPNNREYGVVALVPKEMYEDMPRTRGRFMAYSAKGWRFIQGRKIGDGDLAKLAHHWAGRERIWRDSAVLVAPAPEPTVWAEMGEDEKLTAFREWLGGRDYEPTLAEIMDQFSISKPTAIKWRRALTEE